MKRVQLETPYGSEFNSVVAENVEYARKCARDCLTNHDEAPFASHLIYTQMLDDRVGTERDLGIAAGFLWMETVLYVVVYVDRGISNGMRFGISNAGKLGLPVFFRELKSTDNGFIGVGVDEPKRV